MARDEKVLGIFELIAQGPGSWLEHATSLRIASRRIWSELEAVFDKTQVDDAVRLEKLAYVRAYMLLNGVAVENLFKALAVKRRLIDVSGEKLDTQKMNPRGGHGLTTIAKILKISLTSEETDVLRRLEEYHYWSARYPVPKKARVYDKAHGEKTLSLLSTDAEVIESLFTKISQLVEESA